MIINELCWCKNLVNHFQKSPKIPFSAVRYYFWGKTTQNFDAIMILTYRRLTTAELETLEKKFVHFLVANTITGDDWQRLKTNQPERAVSLIDHFSNLFFEQKLAEIEFLQHVTPRDLKVFHCQKDKIVLLGLSAKNGVEVDFTTVEASDLGKNTEGVEIFKTEKNYIADGREREIFNMLEAGCRVADGSFFAVLEKLYTS